MVLMETMRHHTPVGVISRAAGKDYTLPGTNVVILKGQEVHIPVRGIHMDERNYPNPTKFNPEHFSKKGRAARHPYTFLVFGLGPRMCLGMRFAMLEAKIGIVEILRKFKLKTCNRTPREMVLDGGSNLATPKNPLWVEVEERE
jgi:cytochrome P450 family 6